MPIIGSAGISTPPGWHKSQQATFQAEECCFLLRFLDHFMLLSNQSEPIGIEPVALDRYGML
jgi:hypothetical protein